MFESHGKFIVTRKANIIEVEATGPFNQAAVDGYQADVLAFVDQIPGGWGQIVYMYENCLYTPNAEKKMYSFAKKRKDAELQAIAMVFVDNNVMQIVKDKIADFYQSLDIPHQFFTDKAQAEKWLDAQLSSNSCTGNPLSTNTSEISSQLACHS